MGCASSTEVITDPSTGKQKTKKTLGGNYPGNRPPQHAVYRPNDFDENGQAVAHFVAYGGGNALTLQTGSPTPNSHSYSNNKPEYIQVTLPYGVVAGQTIHVQAPDGRLNAIVVPPGLSAGSTFTVEFITAPDPTALTSSSSSYSNKPEEPQQPYYVPTITQASVYDGTTASSTNASYDTPTATNVTAIPYNPYAHFSDAYQPQQHNGRNDPANDGFASGFGR